MGDRTPHGLIHRRVYDVYNERTLGVIVHNNFCVPAVPAIVKRSTVVEVISAVYAVCAVCAIGTGCRLGAKILFVLCHKVPIDQGICLGFVLYYLQTLGFNCACQGVANTAYFHIAEHGLDAIARCGGFGECQCLDALKIKGGVVINLWDRS